MNITKIKYINVEGRIYEVTDISFTGMSIKAVITDKNIVDVPASELFDYKELDEFRIKLDNCNKIM